MWFQVLVEKNWSLDIVLMYIVMLSFRCLYGCMLFSILWCPYWSKIYGMSILKDADGRISMFLGNTLYAVALIYYSYITFLGYNCISLLKVFDWLCSVTISEWDAVVVGSYSCDTGVVYYQFIWVSCIEDCRGDVFSKMIRKCMEFITHRFTYHFEARTENNLSKTIGFTFYLRYGQIFRG